MSKKRVQTQSFMVLLLFALSSAAGWASETPDMGRPEDKCGSTSSERLALLPVEELIQCARDLRDDVLNRNMAAAAKPPQAPPAPKVSSKDPNRALGATEKVLRQKADFLVAGMDAAETAKASNRATGQQGMPTSSGKTKAKAAKEDAAALEAQAEQSAADQLAEIRSLTSYRKDKTLNNFTDYDDFFSRLNLGYEFVNLNKAFDQGFPRVAMLINLAMGGSRINELVHGWQKLDYGSRLSFAATLTSSAEQAVSLPKASAASAVASAPPAGRADTPDTTQPETRKTFEFEIQSFTPLYRTASKFSDHAPGLRNYIGPLFTVGGLKTDKTATSTIATDNSVDFRYYGGLRFAFSPEHYWDLLYGKTESLRSRRLEVRGQIPVHKLASGDRIYLGAIGNFRVNGRHSVNGTSGDENNDVIRIYLSWNADLGQLFSSKQSAGGSS